MLAADSGTATGGEEEEDVSEYEQNRETNSHYCKKSEDEPDSEHNPLSHPHIQLQGAPHSTLMCPRRPHWMVFMKCAKIKTYSEGFKALKTDCPPLFKMLRTLTAEQFSHSFQSICWFTAAAVSETTVLVLACLYLYFMFVFCPHSPTPPPLLGQAQTVNLIKHSVWSKPMNYE